MTILAADPNPTLLTATSAGEATGTVKSNSVVTGLGSNLRAPTSGERIFVDLPGSVAQVDLTDIVVAEDGRTFTANLGAFPTGYVAGEGYMVWLNADTTTLTTCVVNVE